MRAALLAAGAAGMYCGSCLRDNRLAAALRRAGRDVVLIPLYTPLTTDEPDASDTGIYFGGARVYLNHAWSVFRALPSWVTGWLDRPGVLKRLARSGSSVRPEQLGPLTLSVMRGENGEQRNELSRLIAALGALRVDLVNVPNLMFLGVGAAIRKALGAAVVCTISGEDVFLDQLPGPYRAEASELIRLQSGFIDAFIATSGYCAAQAQGRYGLPDERVFVAPLGVTPENFEVAGQRGASTFTIGYLARIAPEEGLAQLCDAFASLIASGRDCRLRAAGYLSPADRAYFKSAVAELRGAGARDRFEYVGPVDLAGKRAFLATLDVLSVPTVLPEAKGLYVLEALAAGLPVVQPAHGSFPELIEATGGGVLYDPARRGALAEALAQLMDDVPRRRALAAAGHAAVREKFTAERMAAETWWVYEHVLSRAARGSRPWGAG
jgi:glycosyltransferase involved in cell wall biosynthesis